MGAVASLFGLGAKPVEALRPMAPPSTPRRATAAIESSMNPAYQSMVATGSVRGLKRKAKGAARTLLGGS